MRAADLMQLVASRNRIEFEKQSTVFIQSLDHETDPEVIGLLRFVKGIVLFMQNKYDGAIEYFEQILDQGTRKNDLRGIAHMGLGLTYRSTGDIDEAVTHLTDAIELIDRKGVFRLFLAYCYQSLGDVNATIDEHKVAIDFFERAFEVSKGIDPSISTFRYHMGLGGCFQKMKAYEKSKMHLVKALEVADLPPTIVSRIENDLGVLHLELEEYHEAEKYLKRSLIIREEHGLEDAACTTMTALAEVYLNQQKHDEVLKLVDRCNVLVDKHQTKAKKLKLLHVMARVHAQTGNYQQSAQCYEQYFKIYNELKSEQERNIFKFKNEQIERQRVIIQEKHNQLAATLEEIKRLKVDRKANLFSWGTIIILFILSELVLDPMIESYSYNNLLGLLAKASIALLFKPLDGLYEKILWERTMRKVD